MTYKEKKRSMFLGLPWTFTTYTVTDEFMNAFGLTSLSELPDLPQFAQEENSEDLFQ